MRVDDPTGFPKAGSAALVSEKARGSTQSPTIASAIVNAGRSARIAKEQCDANPHPGRTSGLSIDLGRRRERIFTPRPKFEQVEAPSSGIAAGPCSVSGTISPPLAPLSVEAGSENYAKGNRTVDVPASESDSRGSAGSFSPLKSVLRLFSKLKVAGADPS